jgi:hypothetical protein
MKHLKIVAFTAAVAAATMAFVGLGTASADVLCTTSGNPCANKITTIEASLSKESANLADTSGNALATCTVGTLKASITSQGSGVNPSGPITSLTWGAQGAGCNTTFDTVKNGSFEVRTEGSEATVWIKDTEVTLTAFGVSCTYGPGSIIKKFAKFLAGAIAHTIIDHILKKLGGSFLCPETVRWTGDYGITNHSAAFVTNE